MKPAEELLCFFISLFPNFEKYWESDDNYFLNDDGSYSVSGVAAHFSHYFYEADNFVNLDEGSLVRLFQFVEGESMRDRSYFDDALFTCFVENIACTNAGRGAKKYMGNNTSNYFMKWHQD